MKKRTDQDFYDALEAVGHKLVRDKDGDIDFFQLDAGFHNGPGCEKCHETWCQHCEMRKPEWNFPPCNP
jgi:hypothetical protein